MSTLKYVPFLLADLADRQHYDIAVKTDLISSPPTFSGESIITLDIENDTSTLVFNAHKSLKISHIAISTNDLKTSSTLVIPVDQLTLDEDQERGKLNLSSLPGGGLKAGTKGVKVWMRFEGELQGNMVGYYKSEGSTDEETGKKQM